MVLWLFYFSTQWNKGLKLKIPLFKWKQLLPGADRNLCSKLTAKGYILPLTQPPTAHRGGGSSVHWLRGLLFFGGLLWFLLFFFCGVREWILLKRKSHAAWKCHHQRLLVIYIASVYHLGRPLPAPCIPGKVLFACFPSGCSKHSWPGKGTDISGRSPPWALKPKINLSHW